MKKEKHLSTKRNWELIALENIWILHAISPEFRERWANGKHFHNSWVDKTNIGVGSAMVEWHRVAFDNPKRKGRIPPYEE